MENMRENILFRLFLGVVLFIVVSFLLFAFWTTSRISNIQICRTLGSNLWSEPRCKNAGGVFELIEERFPVGTTSRDEVRSVLEKYLVVSSTDFLTGNPRDSYGITPYLFSNAIVEFYFNENNTLERIYFQD